MSNFQKYVGTDTRVYGSLDLTAVPGVVYDFGVLSVPGDGRWQSNAGPATGTFDNAVTPSTSNVINVSGQYVFTTGGAPTAGTFAPPQLAYDLTGNSYGCTVAGSPGTWVALTAQSGTFVSFAQSRLGLPKYLPRRADVDRLMATPPTIGAATTTNPLSSGVWFPAVSSVSGKPTDHFTYLGATNATQVGGNFPDNDYVKFPVVTTTNSISASYTASFWCYGSSFAVYTKGSGGRIRVRVNGEPVQATACWTLPSDGNLYFLPVTFATADHRHISIEVYNSYWGGVWVGATDTITKTKVRGPRVVFLGDSFTEGTGATDQSASCYIRKMGAALGWSDLWNSGVGSTGYLNPGSTGRVKFRDRVAADVIAYNPDIVVVEGGINDVVSYSASAIGTEAAALFAAIKTGLPNAILVVLSPMWRNGVSTFPSYLLPCRDAIKSAAVAAGAVYLDVLELPLETAAISGTLSAAASASATTVSSSVAIPLRSTVEIGTGTANVERRVVTGISGSGPYSLTVKALGNAHSSGETVIQVGPCLWTGTGRTGATTGDGNSDVLVSSDATHPTQAGHDVLGWTLADLLTRQMVPA